VLSVPIISEYLTVGARPKHKPYRDTMLAITDLLEQVASIVEPAKRSFGLLDPDDEIYLATALAGRAEALITGNVRHFPARRYRAAAIDLAAMVRAEGLATTAQVVDYLLLRFMSVPLGGAERQMLIDFLDQQLGTSDIARADSYLEDPLRTLVHLIMSQPENQLG
jgi:predicted nucleic acid-binding protein